MQVKNLKLSKMPRPDALAPRCARAATPLTLEDIKSYIKENIRIEVKTERGYYDEDTSHTIELYFGDEKEPFNTSYIF